MRVSFKVSDKCTIEAEGETHKAVFNQLVGLAEVFSVDKCGVCGSSNILPIKRIVDDVNFYECRCKDCTARMSYGQSKTGEVLYPRRKYHKQHPDVKSGKVQVGDYLPNNGWAKWVNEKLDDHDEEVDETPKKNNNGGKKK